jgi:hypothetical protein
MTTEEENLTLQLIRGLRGDVAKLDAKLEQTRLELGADLRGEMKSLRADLASNMRAFCKQTGEQIEALHKQISGQIEEIRQTIDYHSAAVGHAFSSTTFTPSALTKRRIARDDA